MWCKKKKKRILFKTTDTFFSFKKMYVNMICNKPNIEWYFYTILILNDYFEKITSMFMG